MANNHVAVPGVHSETAPALWARKSVQGYAGRTVVFAVAAAGSILFLIPFVWAVSTSLKEMANLFAYPPAWIPNPVVWFNYVQAHTSLPFARFYMNTLTITAPAIIGDVFISTLVAYGFARMRFPGRDALFMVLLATMMLPMQVTMIPVFIIFRNIGWVDTFFPLIVPAFFGNAFYVFLLRQFFLTIPNDLEDAAHIDGAGPFQILVRVFVPLSLPAMATVAIFSFMRHWQDFFMPLIYLNSKNLKTVSLGLQMFREEYGTRWNEMMAAAVVSLLPCVILFFFAQRYFIAGIVMTGIKE